MNDPQDVIAAACEHLLVAAEMIFYAGDLFADKQAEYHGDRDLGKPGTNPFIDRLYTLSALIERQAEELDRRYLEV